jgi:predicted ArsR family transcriptional regulator
VLDVLRAAAGPVGIAQVAAAVGVHPNTARFHLDALVEQGAVVRTLDDPSGPGRPRVMYAPRPGMDRGGARRYQTLSRILVSSLASGAAAEADALAAGRAWGAHLVQSPPPFTRTGERQAVGALSALLADLDFEPRHVPEPGTPGRIRLEHCPFLELAEEYGRVVCPLHLGLIQGALARLEAPVRAEKLQPFAEPGACLVHLAAREPSTG